MSTGCTLKSLVLSLVLVLLLALVAVPVMAQEATPAPESASTAIVDNDTGDVVPAATSLPELPGDVIGLVAFLALNAVSIVATLEKFGPYQKLSADWKFVITFAMVVVVFPLGSDILTQVLTNLPKDTLDFLNHYYSVIVKGWYMWGPTFFAYYGYKKLTAPTSS